MPSKNNSSRQLNMSYSGDNRFEKSLRNPSFFIIPELVPEQTRRSNPAIKELLKFISDDSRLFATAVTDRTATNNSGESQRAAERTVEDASAITAKPVLSVIAGKGTDFDGVAKKINALRAMGLRDFIAVTGNLLHPTNDDDAPEQASTNTDEYTDSVDIVRLAVDSGTDTCPGATVNPFKYIHEDQFFQYVKMIRKINCGARFIVSQAGWDMKKYQELMWFLRSREIVIPMIARIAVLTPSGCADGAWSAPGIRLPLFLAAAVERGTTCPEKFLNAQAELAAFTAVGCKMMGYSGIQLTGIKTPQELENFLDKFDDALAHYPTYRDWATAWKERFGGSSFVPFSSQFSERIPFYLYNSLMNPELRDYDAMLSDASSIPIPSPSLADKVQSKLASPDTPQWIKKTASRWTGHKNPRNEQIAQCLGLDNASCPKHLSQGPCGGSTPDGLCEAGKLPCFFQRVIRLAAWNRQIDFLEDNKK